MSVKVEKVGGTNNCEVTAGFSHTDIYIGFIDEMESITYPKKLCELVPDANLDDMMVIGNNHTFKAGKNFIKILAIAETVGLETTQIGVSTKSPAQENKLTVQMLGATPDLLGFKRWCLGREAILLASEAGSKRLRQLGSKKSPCWLSASSSKIEKTLDGENTTTFVFSDKQVYDAPYYLGDLSGVVEYFKTDAESITTDRDDITCDID